MYIHAVCTYAYIAIPLSLLAECSVACCPLQNDVEATK